jgi:hypothetical protein
VEGVRGVTRNLAIVTVVGIVSTVAGACSLAPLHGYFHQVTAIRGRVVGKSLGPFQFRWIRQSFGVRSARVALYEYRWPARIEELNLVSLLNTDKSGNFDFGSIAKGHYVLIVSVKNPELMGAAFDVEVTEKVKATGDITIDVSPIRPDCSGGLEFTERKKS